jgi:polyisoprenoid-binding protein YceI
MSVKEVSVLPSTDIWEIDTAHSLVSFSIRHHAVASFRATFAGITGSYDAATGLLRGEVPADGIQLSGPLDRLRGHLLGSDFFNAEQYPTFSFTSSSFGELDGKLTFTGDVTLRGVTQSVAGTGIVYGPLTIRRGNGDVGDRFGVDLKAVIDRRDFDIKWNSEVAEGIVNLGWDVAIEATLELVGPLQSS